MKKAHGEHNQGLCEQLLAQGKYYDWVVTTAFYSSIHYIDHKLFPVNHNGNTLNDIEQAQRIIRKPSRHRTRKMLVSTYCPSIISSYNFLDSTCKTARYVNYQIQPAKANLAKQYLDQIVAFCCP